MKNLATFFADLHIHIGRTMSNRVVKVTAARNLTFTNILHESANHKGIDLIGIIDAHVSEVQAEIETKLQQGIFTEHPDGGICYRETTCLLGAEIEIRESGMSPAHLLVYLPRLEEMRALTDWLSAHMKNVSLSTQRLYQPASSLLDKAEELGGLLIPAHVFTPFKSILGSATTRINNILPVERLLAVELGLSSDTKMADQLTELQSLTFLSNSDAHSLAKIGREYQQIRLKEPSFHEWKKALRHEAGRAIIANYGLNPQLGKYHQTRCAKCFQPGTADQIKCQNCGSKRMIGGVAERIRSIADQESRSPSHRPPYYYQVPLEFLPKVGPQTIHKLLDRFGTEMDILHHVPLEQIASYAGESLAQQISQMRAGKMQLQAGGAGKYGQVISS